MFYDSVCLKGQYDNDNEGRSKLAAREPTSDKYYKTRVFAGEIYCQYV